MSGIALRVRPDTENRIIPASSSTLQTGFPQWPRPSLLSSHQTEYEQDSAGFCSCCAVPLRPVRIRRTTISPSPRDCITRVRYELAADAFGKFIQAHAGDEREPLATLFWGLAHAKNNKHKEARSAFQRYIQKNPNGKYLYEAYYRLGRSAHLLQDDKAAVQAYGTFLQKFPTHDYRKWVLPAYAESLSRSGQLPQAVIYFRKSLDEFPKGPMAEESQFGLARSLELQKKPADAIPLYQQVIANPNGRKVAQAMLNLSAIYFERKQYDDAATVYASFVKKFPQHDKVGQAYLNAGFARHQQQKSAEAIPLFKQAAKDPGLTLIARYWEAMARVTVKDYQQAADIFEEIYDPEKIISRSESMLYYLAYCNLKLGKNQEAIKLFLQVVKGWPKGQFGARGMVYAADAALEAKDFPQARTLLIRFEKEYPDPGSVLKYYHEIQKGRYFLEQGGEENLKLAENYFKKVLAAGDLPSAQQLSARVFLARTSQKMKQHDKAVEVLKPVAEEIKGDKDNKENIGALTVYASSLLATDQYAEASEYARDYLARAPKGDLADQAYLVVAIAEAYLKNKEASYKALQSLIDNYPQSDRIVGTILKIAELAYANGEWEWAKTMFQKLVGYGNKNPLQPAALSGLGWSHFKLSDFEDAARVFQRLVNDFPDASEYAPEAAYMIGDSLRNVENKEQDALKAFSATFEKLAPEKPPAAGAEQQVGTPDYYAFKAGLFKARIQRQLKKIPEAASAYEVVLEKFPNTTQGDALLDEWGVMHLEVEQFNEADKVFRRLVKDYPNSPKALDARFNLAESDLINGRIGQAKKEFESLLQNADLNPVLKEAAGLNLVKIAVELKKWSEVETLAGTFLQRHSQSQYAPEVQLYLGEALLNLDKLEEARKALVVVKKAQNQQGIGDAEWFSTVFVLLGEVYYRQKNYDQVVALAGELKTLSPDDPQLYKIDELLGRSYKQRAKFKQAREAFERVVSNPKVNRSPTAARAQFLIGETWLFEKEYQQALVEFLKVSIQFKYPEWQAPALLQAGKCHEELQEYDKAKQTYKQLATNFP